jgi:hypothetical protein
MEGILMYDQMWKLILSYVIIATIIIGGIGFLIGVLV